MKNRLVDLNDHLFCQLERLGSESLSCDQLKAEVERGKVISDIAENVVKNAALLLRAKEISMDYRIKSEDMPKLLTSSDGNE